MAQQYRPGDIANGYVLTERDGWVRQLQVPVGPGRRRPRRRTPWAALVLLAVVLVVLVRGCAGGSETAETTTSPDAAPADVVAAPTAAERASVAEAEPLAADRAAAAEAERVAQEQAAAAAAAEAERVAAEQAAAAAAVVEAEAARVAAEQAAAAAPAPVPFAAAPTGDCHPSYDPCVPLGRDYDCPELDGPYGVVGPDEYRLDSDDDGVGCEAG